MWQLLLSILCFGKHDPTRVYTVAVLDGEVRFRGCETVCCRCGKTLEVRR